MRKILPTLLLIGAAAAPAVAGDCAPQSMLISDRAIVRIQDGAAIDEFITLVKADHPEVGLAAIDAVPGRNVHLVQLDLPPEWGPVQFDAFEDVLDGAYPSIVQWGEFLYADEAPEGTTGSTFVDGPVQSAAFLDQYAAGLLRLGDAHLRATGQGVVVAVLDTGLDVTHELIAGRVAPGGANLLDGTADVSDTGDGDDGDGDGLTDEMVGHGTFVAGLVLLTAPDARILPVKVIDDEGVGDLWTLGAGICHAIDRGVEVINISIASTYDSDFVEDAIAEARSLGIPVVAAAGNCDVSFPEIYPAAVNGVIAVAATNRQDQKASFSNFGSGITISAPGDSELEPVPSLSRSIISAGAPSAWGFWEGTSMATPLVAGAAALVRSQHPEWAPSVGTAIDVGSALTASAVDIGAQNPAYTGQLGAGRLDAAAATDLGPLAPAPGDLDASGAVDVSDLVALILDWGLVHSSADLDGDGVVSVGDLVTLILNWG